MLLIIKDISHENAILPALAVSSEKHVHLSETKLSAKFYVSAI